MKEWNSAFPKIRRIENMAVNIICFGLLLASLFFACCILLVACRAAIYDGWHLSLCSDCVRNMQSFWIEYAPLVKAFFYSLTLFVACHSLTRYIDVETTRSLGEIRTKLNDEPKKIIHDYILSEEDNGGIPEDLRHRLYRKEHVDLTDIEVLDYLGTLELGAIMLYRGTISEKEFFNQFGYRFENLEKSFLIKIVNKSSKYYQPLLYALFVIKKMKYLQDN